MSWEELEAKIAIDPESGEKINKPDEVKPDEVKPDEVKPDEVKPDEVKPDEVKLDEVKLDEVKLDEVKPDEVKASSEDISSLKSKLDQALKDNEFLSTELEQKYEETNPEKLHGSKENYHKKLIYDKGKEEGLNKKVVETIINNDLSKLDNLTLIMLDIESKSDEFTGEVEILKSMALKKIGINLTELKKEHKSERKRILEEEDKDIGEFKYENINVTPDQRGEAITLASGIRKKFKELKKVEPKEWKGYKEFKTEKLGDINKKREDNLEKWGDRINEVTKDLNVGIKYKDAKDNENASDFIDNEFNQSVIESTREKIANEGIEPTQENINKLRENAVNEFWSIKSNRQKAIVKMLEDTKAKTEEDLDSKYENRTPISKEVAPTEVDTDKEKLKSDTIKFYKGEL